MLILGAIVIVLAITAAFFAYKVYSVSKLDIPKDVAKKANFSILVPQRLPGDYKVIEDSFTYSEDTLVFRAEDSNGASIAFTEQKKPANLKFEDFYKGQFKDAKTLDGVPHPSVIGKDASGERWLLSIVAQDTWLLASTLAPLDADALETIARGIKKY
jgi:hypothetical protein